MFFLLGEIGFSLIFDRGDGLLSFGVLIRFCQQKKYTDAVSLLLGDRLLALSDARDHQASKNGLARGYADDLRGSGFFVKPDQRKVYTDAVLLLLVQPNCAVIFVGTD